MRLYDFPDHRREIANENDAETWREIAQMKLENKQEDGAVEEHSGNHRPGQRPASQEGPCTRLLRLTNSGSRMAHELARMPAGMDYRMGMALLSTRLGSADRSVSDCHEELVHPPRDSTWPEGATACHHRREVEVYRLQPLRLSPGKRCYFRSHGGGGYTPP